MDKGGTVPARIIDTLSIVPVVADRVKIAVLAAGDIGDVQSIQAELASRAEGDRKRTDGFHDFVQRAFNI